MNELLSEEQIIEDDIEAVASSSSSSSIFLPDIECLNPGLEKVCEEFEDSHANEVNYFDNVAGSCDWDGNEINEKKIENPEDNAEMKEFEDGCGMIEKEKGMESIEEEENIEENIEESFANNIAIENRQPESEIFSDRNTLLTSIGVDQSRLPEGDLTVDGTIVSSAVLHLGNLVTNEFNCDNSSEDKLSLNSLGSRPPEVVMPVISPEEEKFNEDKPIPQQIIDDDSESDESLDPIVYAQPNCDDDADDLECLMNKDNVSSNLENTDFDYVEVKATKSVKQIQKSMTNIQIESNYTEGSMDITTMLSQMPHAGIFKSEDLDESSCMVPVEDESKMNTALPESSGTSIFPECSSIFRSERNASVQGYNQSSAQVTNIQLNTDISDTSCPGERPLEKYLGELVKDKASKKHDICNRSNDSFKMHENHSGDVEYCEEDAAFKDTEPEVSVLPLFLEVQFVFSES